MVVDLPFTLHPTFSFRNLVCQTKCKMEDATAGTCRKKNNRHVLRTHGTSSTTPISPHLRLLRSLPASQPHSLTAPSLLRYLPASQTPLSHRSKFPPLFARFPTPLSHRSKSPPLYARLLNWPHPPRFSPASQGMSTHSPRIFPALEHNFGQLSHNAAPL